MTTSSAESVRVPLRTARLHKRTCRGTDADLSLWQGARGEAMRTCRECLRATTVAPSSNAATLTPAPVLRSYVCSEHTDEPVTPTGRGCAKCASRCAARRKARADKRRNTPTRNTKKENAR